MVACERFFASSSVVNAAIASSSDRGPFVSTGRSRIGVTGSIAVLVAMSPQYADGGERATALLHQNMVRITRSIGQLWRTAKLTVHSRREGSGVRVMRVTRPGEGKEKARRSGPQDRTEPPVDASLSPGGLGSAFRERSVPALVSL